MMSKVPAFLLACQVVPDHHDLVRHTVARSQRAMATGAIAPARLLRRTVIRIAAVPVLALCLFGPFACRVFLSPFRSSPFIWPFALLPFALLVCAACPVSVSVRPARPSARKLRGTRDTTPDLCRSLCYLPRLHPSRRRCRASCWSRTIEVSCFTRRSAGRDRVAVVQRARGERAMAWIALRDQKSNGPGSPSREVITCASDRKSLSDDLDISKEKQRELAQRYSDELLEAVDWLIEEFQTKTPARAGRHRSRDLQSQSRRRKPHSRKPARSHNLG